MAQEVGFYQDNVVFEEGPFVMSNPLGNGYRIEVELKGHYCPVLPHSSIYKLCEMEGYVSHKSLKRDVIAATVDWLNGLVKDGVIVLKNNTWVF